MIPDEFLNENKIYRVDVMTPDSQKWSREEHSAANRFDLVNKLKEKYGQDTKFKDAARVDDFDVWGEPMYEDEDENPYKSSSRIKRQVIPTSHRPSKLQDICTSNGIKRGDNVFVRVGNDYQHCAFLRAGEKGITVHNYKSGTTEWYNPQEVYQSINRKMIAILGANK